MAHVYQRTLKNRLVDENLKSTAVYVLTINYLIKMFVIQSFKTICRTFPENDFYFSNRKYFLNDFKRHAVNIRARKIAFLFPEIKIFFRKLIKTIFNFDTFQL